MKRAVLAAVALLGVSACGGESGSKSDKLVVRGVMTLHDDAIIQPAYRCEGTGGYSDFGAGMNVTIKDGEGNLVGVGDTQNFTEDELTAAEGDDDGDSSTADTTPIDPMDLAGVLANFGGTDECWVRFEVPVKKVDFYQVEVGKRGSLSFSFEQMEDKDWFVELTLGE